MRKLFTLAAFVVVAACGADDPPFRPSGNVGISVGPNGVTPNVGVGATNGTFNVGLSL
ncbi:hypothetical protein [Pseudooctadecabacter jejudonensis]|uniref:Lipoprotein n=1 Tax=Pseudooctadecabacter jejudonensis TaxID=1391910 RepID=A0A1Y5T4J1_9RHOB|nr:hypothetical protein [Pseudooctadecabacter jejudonensis]SLN54011.1 hypothetical protein PSJ8397_02817 [Pseudooctadecabacter jejudonensis]